MPQSWIEKRRIDGFPFHRFRTTSPRQRQSWHPEGILRRLIRRNKGGHKEHKEHIVFRKFFFVPFVFFVADLASPITDPRHGKKRPVFRMNAERIGKGSRPFPNPGALSDCRCMRKATRQDPRISTQGVGPKGRGIPRPEGAIQSASQFLHSMRLPKSR